ncbi:MAG: zinc ABC transporter substrate-binding protein [Chloroflexi bacterium]|nr:zinc ABC transporter substrate-binding protein [Chloroflexota bacterium]
MNRTALILTLIALLLAACGRSISDAAPEILTSTTFLADITGNIARDRLIVDSLLPFGADPHSYQPTPQDVVKIEQSRLLIINGAGYEHFIESLLENAGGERQVVEASAGIPVRVEAQSEGEVDPHMWLDPTLVMIYVENIREELIRFDPDGAEIYRRNADAYLKQLLELDAWITAQVNQIPAERRLLVTNHEALGYFADRYGFQVIGSVIQSFSGNASPSAQQMAGLVDRIETLGVSAVFLDASDSDLLARQIAEETGVWVVSDLHLESLTEGPPAATYVDLMKHNVARIVDALK